MVTVFQSRVQWGGFVGAPGYSIFHWQALITDADRNAAGAALRTFFNSIALHFQTGWSFQVLPEVVELDRDTGALVGAATMTTVPTVVNGTQAAGPYAGGAGAVINWATATVAFGHRVRARTFLAPVAANSFEADGTPTSVFISDVNAACAVLAGLSSPDLVAYSRHYNQPKPPHTQIAGAIATITGGSVKDAASGLRSRRS